VPGSGCWAEYLLGNRAFLIGGDFVQADRMRRRRLPCNARAYFRMSTCCWCHHCAMRFLVITNNLGIPRSTLRVGSWKCLRRVATGRRIRSIRCPTFSPPLRVPME